MYDIQGFTQSRYEMISKELISLGIPERYFSRTENTFNLKVPVSAQKYPNKPQVFASYSLYSPRLERLSKTAKNYLQTYSPIIRMEGIIESIQRGEKVSGYDPNVIKKLRNDHRIKNLYVYGKQLLEIYKEPLSL